MTGEAKKIARYRLFKRLGIIGLAVSSGLAVLFLVLSLLPQGNAAFTIRIDNPFNGENSNFKMHLTSGGSDSEEEVDENGVTYAKGDPLKTVSQTTATHVEQFLEYKRSRNELAGSTNMMENDLYTLGINRKEVDDPSDLALVFTVYLTNETNEVNTKVHYGVDLEGYDVESGGQLLESARILIQTEDEEGHIRNVYYGKERNQNLPFTQAYDNGDSASREIIADYVTVEETSSISVAPGWDMSKGNDGYCEKFLPATEKRIVDNEITIKEKTRFTFVCYFERKDPDQFPYSGYLLLSLHFGL